MRSRRYISLAAATVVAAATDIFVVVVVAAAVASTALWAEQGSELRKRKKPREK